MFTNWKTTLAGIGAVLLAIGHLVTTISTGSFGLESLTADAAAVITGVGLLFGKDWNITGGNKPNAT